MAVTVARSPSAALLFALPECRVTQEPDATVIWLCGEQDAATVPAFCELLAAEIAASDDDIIVDLGEVTFIDGAMVGALLRGRGVLHDRERWLTVRSPGRSALRVLGVCGVRALLDPAQPQPTR